MIRSIFFFLIFCVILAFSVFIIKDKLGFNAVENFDINAITGAFTKDNFLNKQETVTKEEQKSEQVLKKENEAEIYFVTANDTNNVKISTSKKEIKTDSDKFRTTMEALFSGPSGFEKIAGVYSEIPPETKLLGIKEDKNSYTINISDDFEMGGGADSMKLRVKQLVITATQAANGKDVYLEINGKRAEYIGGEGIMILQPLQRNLGK